MNDTAFRIPSISVVTPSYNQGCFLSDTIESVIGQAGDFRIDYIFVDGASTDNSVEVIKCYELLLNTGAWQVKCRGIRHRWVTEADTGQTNALMKGFRMAEGELFAWLNSYDIYLPEALQSATTLFRSLTLNRGLRKNDLELFTWENFRKLSKNRIEIMTGIKP